MRSVLSHDVSQSSSGGKIALITVAAELDFGDHGNAGPLLIDGWAAPHYDAAWCFGEDSSLRLPLAPGTGDLMLEFSLTPFLVAPYHRRQTLQVSVGDTVIGTDVIEADTSVAWRIPGDLVAGRQEVTIGLHHPDSMSPAQAGQSSDPRRLGFAVREIIALWVPPEAPTRRRILPPLPIQEFERDARDMVRGFTGLHPEALMMQFESLGHDCELGLLQRRCGAEPLGLLRFAGISYRSLIEGLDFGFEGIADPALLHCYLDGDGPSEFMVRNRRYGVMYHTFKEEGTTTAAAVLAEQIPILRFRHEKFIDLLHEGSKIFVFQRPERMTEAQALPILTLLRSYGPCTLLYLTARSGHLPGTVEMLRPDLFQGSMKTLTPVGHARYIDHTAWISICANAYRLWRENGGGA